jgi:transcriptional regulator with XRE-family HTH domain
MTLTERDITLVDRIKILCIKHGTNLSRLELEVGLGSGTVSRWVTVSPTCENIRKVADYFGVTIDSLVKGE